MADDLMYEPKVRELLKEADYLLYCSNVELIDNPYAKDDQDTKQIKLTFIVEKEPGIAYRDSDGTTHTQFGYMGRVLGYNKKGAPYKTQAWSEAMLQRKIDPNQAFNFGELMNCRVVGKIEDTQADGITPTNRIDKLKPFTGELPPAQRDPQKPKPVVLNPNGTGMPIPGVKAPPNVKVAPGHKPQVELFAQAEDDVAPVPW